MAGPFKNYWMNSSGSNRSAIGPDRFAACPSRDQIRRWVLQLRQLRSARPAKLRRARRLLTGRYYDRPGPLDRAIDVLCAQAGLLECLDESCLAWRGRTSVGTEPDSSSIAT